MRMVVNQASLVAVRGEHLPIVRLEDIVELPATEVDRPEPLCLVVEIDGAARPCWWTPSWDSSSWW